MDSVDDASDGDDDVTAKLKRRRLEKSNLAEALSLDEDAAGILLRYCGNSASRVMERYVEDEQKLFAEAGLSWVGGEDRDEVGAPVIEGDGQSNESQPQPQVMLQVGDVQIEVLTATVRRCHYIANLLDDTDATVVPIPATCVDETCLREALWFCRALQEDSTNEGSQRRFISELHIADATRFFRLFNTAAFLALPELLDVVTQELRRRLRQKSADELRAFFQWPVDLSFEEAVAAEQEHPLTPATWTLSSDGDEWLVKRRVRLHSLRSAAALNGALGTVQRYHPPTRRYVVRLQDAMWNGASEIKLLASNLAEPHGHSCPSPGGATLLAVDVTAASDSGVPTLDENVICDLLTSLDEGDLRVIKGACRSTLNHARRVMTSDQWQVRHLTTVQMIEYGARAYVVDWRLQQHPEEVQQLHRVHSHMRGTQSANMRTLLTLATWKQDVALVRALLEHGADPRMKSHISMHDTEERWFMGEHSPLHLAVLFSMPEIVQMLLERGANDLSHNLLFSVSSVAVARLLVAAGHSVNETCFTTCVEDRHGQYSLWPVFDAFDLSCMGLQGMQPLHSAALRGQTSLCRAFVEEWGADPTAEVSGVRDEHAMKWSVPGWSRGTWCGAATGWYIHPDAQPVLLSASQLATAHGQIETDRLLAVLTSEWAAPGV